MRWMMSLLVALPLGMFLMTDHVAAEIRPEFAMDSDPELKIPDPIKRFTKKYKPLWLSALARPEADMQRLAAQTIAQAHVIGVPQLDEAVPTLMKIVAEEKSHPAARTALLHNGGLGGATVVTILQTV